MESTPEHQIKEYESQLADVEELLKASPDDPSLLSLRADLQELMAITRQSIAEQTEDTKQNVLEQALEAAVETSVGLDKTETSETSVDVASAAASDVAAEAGKRAADTSSDADHEPAAKKSKKIKDFEIPPHLVPLDTDSEAEKNRKRRAVKALKSKWRVRKKEIESEKKQKSWQSFQKKKKIKDKSIFSTHDGDGKVGVVSGRQLTEFGERKRHSS